MFKVGKCRLNIILKQKNMTQVELADKVGMSKQQINAYCRNESIMSIKTLMNISHVLGISMDEVYEKKYEK